MRPGPVLLAPVLLAAAAWACAALWIDGPASRPLAGLLAAGDRRFRKRQAAAAAPGAEAATT